MFKTEHVGIKLNLYRIIHNDSEAKSFTANSTHDIVSTLIFPELI